MSYGGAHFGSCSPHCKRKGNGCPFGEYISERANSKDNECPMLSATDSLLCMTNNRLVSLLTLLDQSARFDTIDHKILLNRLSYSFGINGTVFKWLMSYLTNRTQSVSVGDLNSSPLPLKYGVPQGSVLGPILFTLYSQPVSDKIRKHNISYQKFADDTQLHKASQPTEFQCLVSDF